MSLGHLLVGDTRMAARVWDSYREESVLGSGVASAINAVWGDTNEATRLAQGSGRATGQALLGGGLLSDLPICKELSKCGRSLGDLIGGGDDRWESARRRWTVEWHEEVTEPGALPKAFVSFSIVGGCLWLSAVTGGLAVPVYWAVITAGGAVFSSAGVFACQGIDQLSGRDVALSTGDVIGCALVGAAGGSTASAAAARVVILPQQRYKVVEAMAKPSVRRATTWSGFEKGEADDDSDDTTVPSAGRRLSLGSASCPTTAWLPLAPLVGKRKSDDSDAATTVPDGSLPVQRLSTSTLSVSWDLGEADDSGSPDARESQPARAG
jgi:hypothetical protein